MARPELKQFGELAAEDFERHPVWIGCHTADYGKPWYDDTNEETFRPWTGKIPVDPGESMLLVRAVIELRDGSHYAGFVTPAAEGWDRGPGGRPIFQHNHILGTQQPQIFVGDQQFGFWGGMMGVPTRTQQELYSALRKTPDLIFPLRFSVDPGLATGITTGQVEGFYGRAREAIHVTVAEPAGEDESTQAIGSAIFFQMSAKASHGYPQPGGHSNFIMRYKKAAYSGICTRCGLYDSQAAPFRFARSGRREPSGFMRFDWVADTFFVRPDIAQEIANCGITGVSFGPALDHRTGIELTDRVQMFFSAIIACAETSHLPTVTCRPENEEVLAFRASIAKRGSLPEQENSVLSPELKEKFRRERERLAALPYCGRVKYHVPTSLALTPDSLRDAPDLFQTAEWFGSGAQAFRLTLASERFVNLVRERRWKGLVFHRARQSGWSERTSI